MKKELPKTYNPADYEDAIYAKWEKSGFFRPETDQPWADNLKREPYSIMMPPPNVTGVLHLGHALENSLMDIMARYQRMNGKKVLLLPGTDHAAVATQAKVEKILIEQGIINPRARLGREKLLEKIREYAEESKTTILKQIKKMGTSCDWSRLAYTFDTTRNRAVNEIFVKMYRDALIYRGKRIINWDAKLQTTISDDEIVWQEEKAPFYYLKYGPFVIATARPETKFGDKYVVMHPDDKRYKKYKHGDKFDCEWINGKVTATVIKDKIIDPKFGTGVMTITPWHDMVDFEIAQRHNLSAEQIIDFNGKLMPIAGEFAGMNILEARPKIVEKLKTKGLVVKVEENYFHRVAKGDRSQAAVEPQIKEQWFVDVNKKIPSKNKSLKDLMREAVTIGHNGDKKQKVIITPERFQKIYLHWIDNLRDWCISRQIWWGHRVPVWYKKIKQPVAITYFVHGTTLDNEAGKSSGHYDVALSELGVKQAKELAELIKDKKFDVVFTSDLKRAVDTAELAFGKSGVKIIKDKRLRECDYGKMERKNEKQVQEMEKEVIDKAFPGGESYRDVEKRINDFLCDLMEKYSGKRVAIMAHKGPQLALDVLLKNKTWEQAFDEDWRKRKAWQPGWDYELKELKYVGVNAPKGKNWTQDEDTLDTWFSSGLWTFSTLGWPNKSPLPPFIKGGNKDLKTFHPTSWMQMGYEILFFWLARMILMSTYALDQIPFKDAYIHGMLRSETGKKFSKSLGNNIDPLEVIAKYGADALRLSVIGGIAPGNDSKFYEEKVAGARNMVNKLWNVARYIITNYELKITNYEIDQKKLTTADNWIILKFQVLMKQIADDLESYQFSQAEERLREFTWDNLADWYLEVSKFEKTENKNNIFSYILFNLLKLWHPFIPFVTEAIWQELSMGEMLIVEEWPIYPIIRKLDKKSFLTLKDIKFDIDFNAFESSKFTIIRNIIIATRNARAENKVEPAKKVKAVIYAGKNKKLIEAQAELIKGLRTGIGDLEIKASGEKIAGAIYAAVGEIEIFLLGAVDSEKEKVRLEKEIANLEKVIKANETKLANKEFVAKAPVAVVEKEKQKLKDWQAELKKFKEQLKNLK